MSRCAPFSDVARRTKARTSGVCRLAISVQGRMSSITYVRLPMPRSAANTFTNASRSAASRGGTARMYVSVGR